METNFRFCEEEKETGIVIEIKYAEDASFDTACREALKQIADRHYEEALVDHGMKVILRAELLTLRNKYCMMGYRISKRK